MPRLIFRDPAFNDINDIADYIARDNKDAARRWYDAVQQAIEQLAAMPGIGAIREFKSPRLRDVRSWPVKGFENYLVFYRPVSGGIELLHVLHGARDVEQALKEDIP